MGYFSNLDIEIGEAKTYISELTHIDLDCELTPEERADMQLALWEDAGKPQELTPEEIKAVLSDQYSSVAWKTAIEKLTVQPAADTIVVFAKK